MKDASPVKLPRERLVTRAKRRMSATLAALWAAGMRALRPRAERTAICRVTWDFGRTWKDWPW